VGAGDDFEAREAELDRRDEELRNYSRHAISFAAAFGFVIAGVLLSAFSRWCLVLGFTAAGAAWIYSGTTAWRGGVHMFGGLRTGGFGQFVLTKKERSGSRAAAVILIAVGVLSLGAALGALR
jgi:1,4-dihydroxy-2-naphthoate octaprenyltransferase